MTLADYIADMERSRIGSGTSVLQYSRFMDAETKAARAFAKAGVFVARVGATVYVRYNNSLTVYPDVPEASTIDVASN